MQLQIRGVPRAIERVFQLGPAQTGALLGRMEGDKSAGLAIPLPHIEQAKPGEPSTLCWSRRHLRFDYRDEAWTVTLLGKEATQLNEQELSPGIPMPIPADREVSLTCGEVSIRVFYSKLEAEDKFATRAVGGPRRMAPVAANPFATINISSRGPQAVLQNAGPMERISVDNLADRTSCNLEVLRSEIDRISTAFAELQQRRKQAEQARDEARIAIANVKQAPSLAQLQAAMERVRTAAQRSRQALSQAEQSMSAVRRAGDQAREIERATETLAQDAAAAMSRMPAHDAAGRMLKSQVDHAREDCRRRISEIDELAQRASKEREQAQAAARSAQDAEEETLTLSSRREADFRRKEQVFVHGRRYAIIFAVLLSAALIGWLVGQLLQGRSDPLEGISQRRLQGQQATQIV